MHQSEQLFQGIFNNIDAAIWSYDKKTKEQTISAGIHKVFGYSHEDFQRIPNLWKEAVYPDDRHLIHEHKETLYSGLSCDFEFRIIHQTGEIKWVHCICTPVLDSGLDVIRINGIVHDITEKKAAEDELQKSRLMLQHSLNNVDAAIWSYDLLLQKVDYTSDGLYKITGYPPTMFRDQAFWQDIIYPDDVPIYQQVSANVRKGKTDISEYRIIHANGEVRWVQIRITQSFDGFTKMTRMDGVIIDITSKKIMEEALHRSEQRSAKSEEMYRLIAENTTDMVRILGVNGKVIYASPSHQTLLGFTPEQYIQQQPFFEIIYPGDSEAAYREFNKMVEFKQPRSVQFRVVNADGQVRFFEEYGTPVIINDEEVEYIVIVSRDITQNKLSEQALKKSEANYRLIAENMSDLLAVIDINGTVRYASPSHKKVLGFDDGTIIGASVFDYIHAEDVIDVQEAFMESFRTGINKPVRFRLVHADGATIYVDCLGTPVFADSGEVERIVVVSRDITDQVRMESRLEKSEERYLKLMDFSPQPMASHRDGRFIYINPAGVQFLGAGDAEEIIGRVVFDMVHPDYLGIATERSQFVIEKKYAGPREYKFIRLDGQLIDVETTSLYDEQTQSTLVVFNDITDRKKMERALQESEERYRRLVELSPVAISVYKDGQFTYVNPTGVNLVGAKRPEDIIGTSLLEWVHPEDKELIKKLMEDTLLDGYSPSKEFRIMNLDGKVIDVSLTSIYDSQSLSVQVVFEDITARKQAERALLESEEFNRRLVEISPEAILLHSDFKFNYVNLAGLALFGAAGLSDMIGQPIMDRIYPNCKEETALRLAGIYDLNCTTSIVEQKVVRYDGSTVDVEIVSTPIPYAGRNAGLTLIRDVTDRKIVERERQLTEQFIREAADRYNRLQTSLDRFSHDMFGVMNVDEMGRRLIKEVQDVMKTTKVTLIEVDRNDKLVIKNGDYDIPDKLLEELAALPIKQLPVCEIIDWPEGSCLKIGEYKGNSRLLCIGGKPVTLEITAKRVWLETITRYVSVLYENFLQIEDLTKELEQIASGQVAPSWLLRLLFNLSENERKHLSQDLHDAALQEQIIWYRKLDQLSSDRSVPQELRSELQLITQGLLDVIYQIRITCNELRPPMLKEVGLRSSLEALFESKQMRTNYSVQFNADGFHHILNDDMLICLYRIVQELLANAEKHSYASQVMITLYSEPDRIRLTYEDNGNGMDSSREEDSFKSMGVRGMKERVRSLDGEIEFHSSPNDGLAVFILIPALLAEAE